MIHRRRPEGSCWAPIAGLGERRHADRGDGQRDARRADRHRHPQRLDETNKVSQDERSHNQASVLAAQSQEQLRSDPGSTLNALAATPHEYTQTVGGTTYKINQSARFVNGSAALPAVMMTGSPRVAIIIPLRDKVQLTARCLTSILAKTDYPHYEILLVDNQSREPETLAYLQQMSQHRHIRTLAFDQTFNFSAINNFAVNHTEREYLLFLNNDTEIIAPGWLRAMLEHITRQEVGVVGAKLLYPNRTVQHAGVVMGISGFCDHAYRNFPAADPGYFGQLQVVRNCSVVTGACMLTRKTLFQAVGGFEAQHLPVAFNDVDLCLKILEKGYLVVWTPDALLYHHEYSSRGDDREDCEKYIRLHEAMAYMTKKWAHYLEHDPYYNPNLTRLFDNYGF